MRSHLSVCCLMVLVVFGVGCDKSSPTAPSAGALQVSIAPNPLSVPAAGQPLVLQVTFTETAGVGTNIDRAEISVVDSGGAKLAQANSFWQGGGCASCAQLGNLHVAAHQSTSLNGWPLPFAEQPPRAGTLTCTVYYTDDLGHANSASVQVPVR